MTNDEKQTPKQVIATAEEDRRFSSRKWRLAVASLTLATLAGVVIVAALGVFLWKGFMTEEVWLRGCMGVLYWWLFVDGVVLSGYGVVNVVEKWAPKVA
jgi:hypothetical protein